MILTISDSEEEILYKIKSVLACEGAIEVVEIEKQQQLVFRDLEIDQLQRKVTRVGKRIDLTKYEYDLLFYLVSSPNWVFTKEQIYRAVWEEDYLLDNSNIMAFIRKLRKKIEPAPDSPTYILTIWGIGYKFNDEL